MEEGPNLYGCLLGIAVSDSIGLPYEGLSAKTIERRLRKRGLSQSFLFGRGMISDDTEQSCLILEAVRREGNDAARFQSIFARKLKGWFLALPAGVGLATVKACLRLLAGISPSKSGVLSAGNGAAMRSPILGVLFSDRPDQRRAFTDASTAVTHSDQRAIDGARVMAEAVAYSRKYIDQLITREELLDQLVASCDSNEWKKTFAAMKGQSDLAQFARSTGANGKVSGFVMQSVPIAIFIWLAEPQNAHGGLESAIRLGGDTDTVGAMLGALYGASLGPEAFPAEWREKISDFPRSTEFLKKLADTTDSEPPKAVWLLCLMRNLFFLVVVLVHGLRRLLP